MQIYGHIQQTAPLYQAPYASGLVTSGQSMTANWLAPTVAPSSAMLNSTSAAAFGEEVSETMNNGTVNTATSIINGQSTKTPTVLYGQVSGGSKALAGQKAGTILKELPRGARLVSAEQDTLFETDLGNIFVAKGSLALIVSDSGTLSVYNLDDTRSGAVVLTGCGETIKLSPGRHVTLTNCEQFELVNPIKTIGYRQVTSRKLSVGQAEKVQSNLTLHSSEFSLPSAIATVAPIKTLVSSSDQKKRKVGQHLLKTTAIMQSISNNALPFELKTPPEATAMR